MEGDLSTVSNDYTEIVRRLSCTLKLAYGVGHVLNDICASMWFTYLLVFFHLVLKFDPFLAGLILLIGQIADAIATPFVGLHSDKDDDFWLCRYGKRKTWHLMGTLCVLMAFPFIFSPCIGCETSHQWAQIIYYSAFVVIFQFGWASVQISHLSLIPDLTPTEHERTELTAIRYSFTVVSNVLVYSITWAVLHITSGDDTDAQIGPNDAHKFQKIMLTGIGIGFVTSVIFHIFVKEGVASNSRGTSQRRTRTAWTFLKDIQLHQVACVYMHTRLFVNLSQTYIPLYLHQTLNMSATSLAIVPLVIFLSSFVVSLIIERLNTKLGRKIAYLIGVLLGAAGCLWIRFGEGELYTKYEIYVVSVLLGAGGSIMLVTSLGVTADLIGENSETGAFIYGIMSFTDKLSNGLAVILIQYMSLDKSSNYFRDILTFVCGGSAIFGLLMLLCVKPFTRDTEYRTLENSNVTVVEASLPTTVQPSVIEEADSDFRRPS